MLRAVLVEGVDSFVRLESAWNELSRSSATSRYTQTFEWAKLGWETKQSIPGDRLACATVWSGERLVAVWPFRRSRLGSVHRLELLGCGMNEEYGDPLMAEDVDAVRVCEHLLRLLRPVADLVDVPYVQKGGPIQDVLARTGPFRITETPASFAIERNGAENFDALLRTYTSHFRARLKQPRKRLQKLGDLRFERVEDAAGCAETIDWMLKEKRKWLLRQQKTSAWLAKNETREFFLAAAMKRSDFGRLGIFRLALDGKPIAATVVTVDRTRVEGMVSSFGPDFAQFSPGMLMVEDVARWSVEHGLDFDMRPLHMDYKARWSNASAIRMRYRLPLTSKGALFLLPDYLSSSLIGLVRATLNAEQRAAIKRVLQWLSKLKNRDQASAISAPAE